jgi:acetyl esterase/lipase
LYFHGGNFTVGSKELLSKSFAENLVDLGFVIVAPNYRLCPTISLYNGPVADTFDAYNWALRHLPAILKRDAGIDVDDKKVVTFGHSCGGTLALLTVGNYIQTKH